MIISLKKELNRALNVLYYNLKSFIIIIVLFFLVGLIDFVEGDDYIVTLVNLIALFLKASLYLAITYITINVGKNNSNLSKAFKFIRNNFKPFIIVALFEIILYILFLTFSLQLLPTIILKSLLIFIWPIFIVESKTKFAPLKDSMSLVTKNFKYLYKLLILYWLAHLLTYAPLLLLQESTSFSITLILFIISQSLNYILSIVFMIMVTNIYLYSINKMR